MDNFGPFLRSVFQSRKFWSEYYDAMQPQAELREQPEAMPKAAEPQKTPKAQPQAEVPKAQPQAEVPQAEAPKAEVPQAQPKAKAPEVNPFDIKATSGMIAYLEEWGAFDKYR